MRDKIESSVNDFVLKIAELYEPILAATLEDSLFEDVVVEILASKEELIASICGVVEVTQPVEPATVEESPSKEVAKDLWTGAHELPRSVAAPGSINENFSGKDFEKMASSAARSLSSPSISSSGFVDEDSNVTAHNLGLSVAEERRIEQGLPAKRKSPVIHVDHTGAKEEAPVIPRPTPKSVAKGVTTSESIKTLVTEETKSILRRLQDICAPHQLSPDKTLSTLACSILAIVSAYLPTDHPEEAPRYESVKSLWAALQNVIGTLKKVQMNLGKYQELSKLQKDLNSVITEVMVDTAGYSLPDEEPVNRTGENPTEEGQEEEDGG